MGAPRFAALVSLLACSCIAVRADSPTPQNWIRWFSDDFEDGTTRRWDTGIQPPPPEASWRIENDAGNAVLTGRNHIWATLRTVFGSDYRFKARVKLLRGALQLNVRDQCTRYATRFGNNQIVLTRTAPCGQEQNLVPVNETIELNRWYVVETVVAGDEIKVYVDGNLKISYTDPTPVYYGQVDFESLDNTIVQVDDVEVTGPSQTGDTLRVVDFELPDGGLGIPYAYKLTATGGVPPYKWRAAGDFLPGLTLDEDGTISGKPGTQANRSVTVMVTDSEGKRAFEQLSFDVEKALITTPAALAPGEVGSAYRATLESAGLPGCQYLGLNLPPGLAIDSAAGVLSGTPALAGAFRFWGICLAGNDVVTKIMGFYATEPDPGPPVFLTRPEEVWDVDATGQRPRSVFRVTGGVPPYTWAVISGDLPAGMRFVAGTALPQDASPYEAVIAGRPTVPGTHRFTLEATDAAGAKASQEYELRVSLIGPGIDGEGPDEPLFMGVPVSMQFKAVNAVGAVRWTALNVPAGFDITLAGKFGGLPAECGLLPWVIQVTDSDNPPTAFRLGDEFPVLCTPGVLALVDIHLPANTVRAKVNEPFEMRIGTGNGTGKGYRCRVGDGALPPGLTLAEGSPGGLFTITGTPTESGKFEVFLRATDSAGNFGVRRLTVVVE